MLISQLIPNPVGRDADNEWIEITNNELQPASLKGWFLKDASGKKYLFENVLISSGQSTKFPISQTKISLNNNGDSIYLYNQPGELIDSFIYTSISEGGVLSKNAQGEISEIKIQSPTDKAIVSQAPQILKDTPLTQETKTYAQVINAGGEVVAQDNFFNLVSGGILISLILTVIFWKIFWTIYKNDEGKY